MADGDAARELPPGAVELRPVREASPFDEGTELGAALAAVDWAATGVGPWPQWTTSLTNAVRMLTASRFSMWMAWGPQLTFFCNDAYRRDTLGEKFPWALGRPSSVVWSEVWDAAGPRIDAVLRGESTWDEGLRLFLERSGYPEETYHTFSYSPLHDDDGRIAGMLCVVTEDTARVLGDRRLTLLRDLGAAVTAGTTRDAVALAAHRRLSGAHPDVPFAAAYLRDPGDDTLRVHWTAGAEVGGPAAPARLAPGDDHPWAAAFDDGGDRVVALDPDVAWPTGPWDVPPARAMLLPLGTPGHGSSGVLAVGLNPFRALDAEYTGFLDLLGDQLTNALARAEAFEQERDRHAQQAELDLAKIQFFTTISHELRTPLTLLLGPAEDALADDTDPLDGRQRGRVELVARNGARLLKLVNQLLDFSRLEAGRMTARFEPLDLSRFTADLAAMFGSAAAGAGLAFTVECTPLPSRPYVDSEMWAKIVLNLLSNALKATFAGGVTVRLADDPHPADPAVGGARLEVVDTGVGIPAGELGRVFERFHRVAGARQRSHEGTGIGLALVAELARLHGGTVDVRSEPGAGSTFAVRIPYGRAHLPADQVASVPPRDAPDVAGLGAGYVAESLRWDAADATDAADADASAPVPDPADGRPRVLVVDDSSDVRDYIGGLLGDDYAVTTARDGAEALAAVRAAPPDLVLTDVMMPVMDGFALLARLREDERAGHLPVIMLSARSGESAAVEGLEAGADDYLVKPFTARELRARVRANLELDRVRRVLTELERSRAMLEDAERLARAGSWQVDLHDGTLLISDQLARTSGIDVSNGPVLFENVLQMTDPADEGRLRAELERALVDHEEVDCEVWAVRTDGSRFRARVRASVVADDRGVPRYLRGSTQDVTEQRAAEAELAAAHALREVAAREHAIAHELQRSLLPQHDFAAPQLEIAAFYRAGVEGTEVGGDWYDVIELDLGRTALVVGDVMGRGVRAAAVMGQLRAATRAYARLPLDPHELVQLLDDTVREIGDDVIVTCVYAVHDPAEHTLAHANAGHLPALLHLPDGSTRRLAAGGPPLGTGRLREPGERVAFPAGAVLALYTDGLVEQRSGADLDSRIDRLAAELAGAQGPLAALPDAVTAALLGDDPVHDDVALLLCRSGARTPGERDARHRVGDGDDAVATARHAVVEVLREWGIGGELDFDVQLAASELVTNAVRHGRRPVELHLHLGDGRLRLAVHDAGPGRPVVRRSGPQDASGRGLMIVATVADAWGIDGGAFGKTVWCEFGLGDAGVG